MKNLPNKANFVKFAEGFAPRSLLTVDTEEEFDWTKPFSSTGYGLDHLKTIGHFQEFCEELCVSPVYLVDWPVATSAAAREVLLPAIRAGKAEIGIQLHPWVNPPIEEDIGARNSYAGNLPPALERDKFLRLRDAIIETFETEPKIYRAGRYGLSDNTRELLKQAKIPLDSSVRSKFDYRRDHGPNYDRHPLHPWWVDAEHSIIELPLTSVYTGLLRNMGDAIFPHIWNIPALSSAFARLGILERISLTPEGVPQADGLRAVDQAVADALPLIVLSFHSPSIVPGNTPYVRSADDLEAFYDWWRAIYGRLAERGVQPTTVGEILKASGLADR